MKRISVAALLLLLITTITSAQRIMKVEKTDGTIVEVPVTDITRVYFEESTPEVNLCPDANHPHMIDLGLPSGVKWSCCNVGASNPEDYGGYYAWGETEEKEVYDWSTYIHCDGTAETLTKYCTDSSYGK